MFTPDFFNDFPESRVAYDEAVRITSVLREAGFVAYFAGGCVRDGLLGRCPKDFDVATDATPEMVRKIFGKKHTLAFGASFGVIGVLPDRRNCPENSESIANPEGFANSQSVVPTEVATFRSDGEYSDGRRPDSVRYGSPAEDALRRDFTINGIFFDPINESVIDFVGGEDDLRERRLQTIGNPEDRFEEDKLRMLRAVRFATTLGFQLDDDTTESIRKHAGEINVVSGERIGAEMRRVVAHRNAPDGLRLLGTLGLTNAVWPGLSMDDSNRLDACFSVGLGSFVDAFAVIMIELDLPIRVLSDLTQRWKLTNEEVRAVSAAMDHWKSIADLPNLKWSEVQPILINRDVQSIVNVARVVMMAREMDMTGFERARDALALPPNELNPPPLLTGNDLVANGFEQGPVFREILQATRAEQLDRKITTNDEALEIAKEISSRS